MRVPLALGFALLLAGALTFTPRIQAADPAGDDRFVTSRLGALPLDLTDEDDGSFTFAVFGDRTGGPAEGVQVLAQAVDEVNLLAPDLVMTVGDLIQGYNTTAEWMPQMIEFRSIMDRLDCPWFPVPGNHDVYWRGEGRPEREHEENYERYFGPLWYAFSHKGCWFITLFADETNPETGKKIFSDPAHQRMSPEQFAWLEETLKRTAGARHVFLFIHHPRWTGGQYGDDWERVHELLVDAGNVSAVFAGHVHHMRYDPADGIDYFTLATVGGGQSGDLPEAGWLHQYTYVTVRDEGIATVSYPVPSAQDPRLITGDVAMISRRATRELVTRPEGDLALDLVAGGSGEVAIQLRNPLPRAVTVSLRAPEDGDPRWRLRPSGVTRVLEPGASQTVDLRVERLAGPIDAAFAPPRIARSAGVLFDDLLVPLPEISIALPVRPSAFPAPAGDRALALDGSGDHAVVPSASISVPDGPFTVEAWMNAKRLNGQRGLVAKTESSEFGLFVGDAKPAFYVHLDGSYRTAEASEAVLETDRWHHVAGVYDGERVRVFVDGQPVGEAKASGKRATNGLPLVIGGDVTRTGGAGDHFNGLIDGVRVSVGARYIEPFEPARAPAADDATLVLLSMDTAVGPWIEDRSAHAAHGELRSGAKLVPVAR